MSDPFSSNSHVNIRTGFAKLVADGISMGYGDFLSSKAELEYAKTERERELWFVRDLFFNFDL